MFYSQLDWRLSQEPQQDNETDDPEERANTKATIFLGYTSNLISSGLREHFRFIAQHRLVGHICLLTHNLRP